MNPTFHQYNQCSNTTDQIIKELICPVELELLTSAMFLMPCGHKLNELATKIIFGEIQSELLTTEKKCPVCSQQVIGYGVDHTTRNLAQAVFNQKDNTQAECLKVEQSNSEVMAFPGKTAKFCYQTGSWNPNCAEDCAEVSLNRRLAFRSVIPESVIQQFELLGYTDGEIRIYIEFKENENFIKFLEKYAIQLNSAEIYMGSFFTENNTETKALFKILAENCEFPDIHFEFIKNIIEQLKPAIAQSRT